MPYRTEADLLPSPALHRGILAVGAASARHQSTAVSNERALKTFLRLQPQCVKSGFCNRQAPDSSVAKPLVAPISLISPSLLSLETA
jgi:hypothetical protein